MGSTWPGWQEIHDLSPGRKHLRELTDHLRSLEREVVDLLVTRYEWQYIFDQVQSRPDIINSLVFQIRARNYLRSQVMSLRALADRDSRTTSLLRLLNKAAAWAPEITEADLRDHYSEIVSTAKNTPPYSFAGPFVRRNGSVDNSSMLEDADRLTALAARARVFADKHVAHLDADRQNFPAPSLDEISDIADAVDEMVCRYALYLTGGGIPTQMPTIIFDWTSPYRTAWLPPFDPAHPA